MWKKFQMFFLSFYCPQELSKKNWRFYRWIRKSENLGLIRGPPYCTKKKFRFSGISKHYLSEKGFFFRKLFTVNNPCWAPFWDSDNECVCGGRGRGRLSESYFQVYNKFIRLFVGFKTEMYFFLEVNLARVKWIIF